MLRALPRISRNNAKLCLWLSCRKFLRPYGQRLVAKNAAYYSQTAGQKLNNFGKFLAQTFSVVHMHFQPTASKSNNGVLRLPSTPRRWLLIIAACFFSLKPQKRLSLRLCDGERRKLGTEINLNLGIPACNWRNTFTIASVTSSAAAAADQLERKHFPLLASSSYFSCAFFSFRPPSAQVATYTGCQITPTQEMAL